MNKRSREEVCTARSASPIRRYLEKKYDQVPEQPRRDEIKTIVKGKQYVENPLNASTTWTTQEDDCAMAEAWPCGEAASASARSARVTSLDGRRPGGACRRHAEARRPRGWRRRRRLVWPTRSRSCGALAPPAAIPHARGAPPPRQDLQPLRSSARMRAVLTDAPVRTGRPARERRAPALEGDNVLFF